MRPRREAGGISSGPRELFLQSLNSFKFTTQMKLYAKIFNYLEHKTTGTRTDSVAHVILESTNLI